MEKEQALQALLDQVVRQGDFIGVSALYLRDGKQLVYAQAGMADRERGIPFARDTICRVFSMSKPITAFAVMKLWEDGKLDLDAPVAAYLPEFGDAEHTNLTIRQLLCMTSGYGYNDNDSVQSAGLGRLYDEISESFTKGGQRTTRQVIAEMAKLPLLYRPGKGWRYGVSADILAAAVEAASRMNYRDFLKQNLLDPLEMVDTDFYVPEAKRGRFAQAYDFNSGAAVPDVVNHLGIQMNMKSLPEFLSGGAGMVSTIDDYAHFATMLMNGGEWNGCRLLKPETVQAMAEPLLNAEQRKIFVGQDTMRLGMSYGHLMSVCVAPEESPVPLHLGEYGWDGKLGTLFTNDPATRSSLLMMLQRNGPWDRLVNLRVGVKKILWE